MGETRLVRDDQTVRWGSVRYSTPPGHVDTKVWCRVHGTELIIVARTNRGLVELCRHQLSTPGQPVIVDAHYPDHRAGNDPKHRPVQPKSDAERAFLVLGDGAERWLREACATGVARIPSKMSDAVELAALVGAAPIDRALARLPWPAGSPKATWRRSSSTLTGPMLSPISSAPTIPTPPSPAPAPGSSWADDHRHPRRPGRARCHRRRRAGRSLQLLVDWHRQDPRRRGHRPRRHRRRQARLMVQPRDAHRPP